ncbi:MAG TPA: hypothetical protein VK631_14885, partial [Solirubrobacteraceae bacterium]|nr:hypothetical protein [Solirubrobacteraceae bacterium]
MVRRIRNALVGIPLMLVLVGCAMDGVAVAIPKTPAQACDDLERAARDFYAAASPNSTMRALDVTRLPEVNGFTIPRPSCSFEFRPDPAVVPGDVFTIENFYLDYDETLTLTLEQDLEA